MGVSRARLGADVGAIGWKTKAAHVSRPAGVVPERLEAG
jgi:hypothetical protein